LDLILLDPPFAQDALFLPTLQAAQRAVVADGWVYLEAPAKWTEPALAALGLECKRYLKAGAVHAHLLRKMSCAAN
jgi:16S rRNA G966 N2-methylase RsmD